MKKSIYPSIPLCAERGIDYQLARTINGSSSENYWTIQLESAVFRRAIEGAVALRVIFGKPRSLVGYWVALEVAAATLDGQSITQKDLTTRARCVWSQATISRAIKRLVEAGYFRILPNTLDRRSPHLAVSDHLRQAFEMHGERTLQDARAVLRRAR